ncbi:cyclic pyranopterin monophosphate synthase [Geobacter sp. OR-1]|uniref:radical SAM protein n=1 Tax=Geobacter sp. OR-1 TaxID=1266765 RepID=UPI0005425424|nr:radical SAM protein [Geobacter sp. OR-1]GAM10553.1 cyclic pyranopterin monophosphate synthase [Geobacter sp. OR-1]
MTITTDKYRIDSHKLMFHPQRVSDWLDGGNIFPIYAEISPSGACNHRCTFCALDYLEYRPVFLDAALLKSRLTEMGRLGVKSVMFCGEGEPLLHREIDDMVNHAKEAGIDAALTTNGVLLNGELFGKMGESLSWLKVSINAGTPETYAAIHRTKEADFDRVIENMIQAAKIARENDFSCTLGAQLILLPENAHEVETLAGIVRDAGLSYLVIKPYSQHLKSLTTTYEHIDYEPYLSLADRLNRFNDDDFRVIFRQNTILKLGQQSRGYDRCLALPFWSHIDSHGNVWGCSAYLGDERFCYGNIGEQGFAEIWHGSLRRASLEYVSKCLDVAECRVNCRMDEVNRYLWELVHPSGHVNFI